MQTPEAVAVTTQPALKDIEETVNVVMKKRDEHLNKKHEKVMNKTDQGQKKIDDVIRRLDAIERKIVIAAPIPVNNQKHVRFMHAPNEAQTNQTVISIPAENILNNQNTVQPSKTQNAHPQRSDILTATHAPNEGTWAHVAKRNIKKSQQASQRQTSQQHVLVGSSSAGNRGEFSADAHLVVRNVAKHITTTDLYNWLAERAVFIKDCKLLTTSEEARFLSFKLTVSSKDYDRLMKDATMWPYGVGVRPFKNFRKNSREDYRDGREDSNARNSNERYQGNYVSYN